MSNVLPDSRLREKIGTVMADWKLPDGTTIRLELEPIYCLNCGKPNGYVPRETMSFVSWLCQPCADKWGGQASLHDSPDQEFWDAVAFEMQARFGHYLTQHELNALADQGRLGTALNLLDRESPYRGKGA
jgi:hypothetical protein